MDDRAALLAAVCDRPDDDTPRLVFADYLDDHGDPEYARFIRRQIELANVPEWDRRWLQAWHRDRDLITGHPFRKRYPPSASWYSGRFRRGFPWDIEYPTPQLFAERAGVVFAFAPFQSFTIRSLYQEPPPDPGPLADDARVNRLRRLAFVLSRLDAAAVRRLADSPHLTGLTELSFEYDAITPDGVEELLTARLPGRLSRLRLHNGQAFPATVLGGYGGTSTLRSLTLSASGLGGTYFAPMLTGPLFRGLAELDLSDNLLGPAGVAALAANPAAASLESLTLKRTAPGVPGVRALAASPWLSLLRRLSLYDCRLGPVAAKALADSPHLRNLSVLDLEGNAIGDKGALALAASPHLRNLAELNLMGAGLTDRGVAALLDSPVTAGLVRLGVSGNLSVATVARVRERFGG